MLRTTLSASVLALTALAHAAPLDANPTTTRLPIAELAGQAAGVLPAEGVLSIDLAGRRYDLAPSVAKRVPVTNANVVRGGLLGEPGSFVLSEVDGFVAGAIWTENGAVELRPVDGTGLVSIVDIDAADLPACMTDHIADNNPLARPPADPVNAPRGTGEDVVRVFVGITTAAQSQLGGPAGALAMATSAIESTNNAYANSEMTVGDQGVITATIELAGTYTVDAPSLDAGGLLSALRNPSDGIMDELHVLRDATKADLVALISRSGIGACGVAYYAIDNPTFGFSVTAQNCAVGNLTFAHELGHNYGAAHDIANAGSGNAPYGFGWRWNTSGGSLRRSVMAYSPGSRRPYFSNPDVTEGGGITGDAAQADNARFIGETFTSVSAFRTGAIDADSDCDGNGVVDLLEITLDPALDSDYSGTLDTCDVQNGLLEDCNGDGLADIGQVRPRTELSPGPITLSGFPPYEVDLGAPIEAAEDVIIELQADADLGATNEYLDVSLNGVPLGRIWELDGLDCEPGTPAEITVDSATWNSLTPPVVLTVARPSSVNPYQCGGNTVNAVFRYTGIDRDFDANGDGILDECAQGCNPADLAEPFGVLDLADIGAFVNAFGAGDSAADLAEPFGVLDLGDIGAFVGAFGAGCP